MRYYALLAVVSLAGFSTVVAAFSVAVRTAWPLLREPLDGLSPARRARWLLALRLFPIACATLAVLALGASFVGNEPRDTHEAVGAMLTMLAVISVGLLFAAILRAVRMLSSESALWRLIQQCRQWTSHDGSRASILDTPYPVAAVAGVLQPRLMLSARVLRECTAAEIAAIVAHERAHVRRRDNLTRAVFNALPDRWLSSRMTRDIEASWMRAAEEAADGDAAGPAPAPRAALAATLIHVSRMADEAPPAWMPQLAFYQGADLERRVRALLAAPRSDTATAVCIELAALASAVSVAALMIAGSEGLHRFIEWSVTRLP